MNAENVDFIRKEMHRPRRLILDSYLMKKMARFIGWQAAARNDVIKQLAARNKLHDHEYVRGSVNHFVTDEGGCQKNKYPMQKKIGT